MYHASTKENEKIFPSCWSITFLICGKKLYLCAAGLLSLTCHHTSIPYCIVICSRCLLDKAISPLGSTIVLLVNILSIMRFNIDNIEITCHIFSTKSTNEKFANFHYHWLVWMNFMHLNDVHGQYLASSHETVSLEWEWVAHGNLVEYYPLRVSSTPLGMNIVLSSF